MMAMMDQIEIVDERATKPRKMATDRTVSKAPSWDSQPGERVEPIPSLSNFFSLFSQSKFSLELKCDERHRT